MDKKIAFEQVTEIFREILEDDKLILTDNTSASDVENWDSLIHIQLVVAIEKHFKVRFSSKEIQSWTNVGEIMDCLLSKNK